MCERLRGDGLRRTMGSEWQGAGGTWVHGSYVCPGPARMAGKAAPQARRVFLVTGKELRQESSLGLQAGSFTFQPQFPLSVNGNTCRTVVHYLTRLGPEVVWKSEWFRSLESKMHALLSRAPAVWSEEQPGNKHVMISVGQCMSGHVPTD